jgi:hypothetical protein
LARKVCVQSAITVEEFRLLKLKANASGRSISDYVRCLIRREIQSELEAEIRKKLHPPAAVVDKESLRSAFEVLDSCSSCPQL